MEERAKEVSVAVSCFHGMNRGFPASPYYWGVSLGVRHFPKGCCCELLLCREGSHADVVPQRAVAGLRKERGRRAAAKSGQEI